MIALAVLIAIVLGAPIGMLLVECLAGHAPARTRHTDSAQRPSVDILMCAYNEEAVIGKTLAALHSHLRPGDRVLVVADNCTDGTATMAGQAGAMVVQRRDLDHRGKDYALRFGLDHLAPEHAPIVVVFDADCRFAPGGLDRLVTLSALTQSPVQAAYRMEPPRNSTAFNVVSHFAIAVKNVVRMRGLARLGMPSLITGSGMAFPWESIRAIPLMHGSVAEDTLMSIDLALQGNPAIFCEEAEVLALLPARLSTARAQRRRWEHGNMTIALQNVPRLLKAAIVQRRWLLAMMALDLSIPPLSLLSLMWLSWAALALVLGASGWGWQPMVSVAATGLLLAAAIAVAWHAADLQASALRTCLTIPWYVISKSSIYLSYPFRRQQVFNRTDRDDDSDANPAANAAALISNGARPGGAEVVGK